MTYVKNKSIILLHLKLMIVAIDECKTKTDAAECEASKCIFVPNDVLSRSPFPQTSLT
jgi:hypothetical protein